jgi:hypothetical protein
VFSSAPAPAKIRTLNRVYEAYNAAMTQLLSQYADSEFSIIEDYLAKTTKLLITHTAKLRERTRAKAPSS